MVFALSLAMTANSFSIPSPQPRHQGCDERKISAVSTEENPFWDVSHVDASHVQPSKKLIALTFDDSPSKTLSAILSTFQKFNIQHPDCPASATLFCNGKHIYSATMPTLKAAHAAQFELGNHTQNHQKLTELPLELLHREIRETDRLLEKVDGNALHLLRAPYGDVNDAVKAAAKTPIIDWLIDTKDWTGISAEDIYETVFTQKSDGAIVLMHDGYDNTVTALERLLPALYHAGYQAVSVSQMAKIHRCTLKIGKVYIRARKIA